MQRASEQRANDTRDEGRRLATADERRHTEAMRRLDALGVRDDRSHSEAMQAFDLQRQALETLIARTAPSAAGERT